MNIRPGPGMYYARADSPGLTSQTVRTPEARAEVTLVPDPDPDTVLEGKRSFTNIPGSLWRGPSN